MRTLYGFVEESNRIEGIQRLPLPREIEAHKLFLGLDRIQITDVMRFVQAVAGAPLRDRPGMDVRVGNHFPPPGGPDIPEALRRLLAKIERSELTPFEAHVAYETLHPFMDGNGRSGRAIWAWQMRMSGKDPFFRTFLLQHYYDSLDACRR